MDNNNQLHADYGSHIYAQPPLQSKPSKYKSCLEGCGICLIGLFALGCIVATFVYIVYVIWGLSETSNPDIKKTCDGNTIWLYVLLSFLLGNAINGGVGKSATNNSESGPIGQICVCMFGFALSLIFAIWGKNNYYDDCLIENYGNTKLYLIAGIQLWVQYIISALYASVLFCYLMYGCYLCGADWQDRQAITKGAPPANSGDNV